MGTIAEASRGGGTTEEESESESERLAASQSAGSVSEGDTVSRSLRLVRELFAHSLAENRLRTSNPFIISNSYP